VSRPQVIDDQEHERVHDRVAAIDVAKDTGMVCTRAPHPSRPGARRSTVWTVKARMGAIRGLGRQLKRDGIEVVTLEATTLIRGANVRNWTLPRSCRRGHVRDEKDKSGNDER
jgi:transposase